MKKTNNEKIYKHLRRFIEKIMILIIIFLVISILSKSNPKVNEFLNENLFEQTIKFTKIKNLYNKYLGGIIPLENITNDTLEVINEEIEYQEKSIYHDGVKLTVQDNYLVPIQKEGMVIFAGEKENYGNVIIIEGLDGINIWYGNIDTTSVKLYDYVNENTYLGTVKNNTLYLVYEKEGIYLSYEEYLS